MAQNQHDDVPASILASPHLEIYTFAVSLAREAGDVIREAFHAPKSITFKGNIDLVTETDQAVERLVMGRIKTRYPEHTFIAEESVSAGQYPEVLTDRPTWLIDPIDGTTNFVHQFPWTCISIGYAVNKRVVVGVVFNPVLNELFTAVRGAGAYKNGVQIHVSRTDELRKCLLATGFAYDRSEESVTRMMVRFRAAVSAVRDIRRAGSAALDVCYVAAGILDTFYEVGIHAWDVAAGSLLVEEAGGTVSHIDGRRDFDLCQREILATNGALHDKVVALLNPK